MADIKMNKERFLNILFEILNIDSPSLEESKMSEYLISYFKDEIVFADDSGKEYGSDGKNVLVHIKGELDLEPICFNAHQDTVEPGRNIKPRIVDNKVISDGTTILGGDDKAGIAMILEAYSYLKENNISHRDMYFLFTLSEEIMKGAAYYDTSNIKSKYIFVLDGAGHPKYLVNKSKGKTILKYEFIGKSAHSGVDIVAGNNAVIMAAKAIANMPNGKIDEDTTINISSINGGEDGPIVPDKAVVTIEIRSYYQDKIDAQLNIINNIVSEITNSLGGSFKEYIDILSPPYIGDTEDYLYKRAKKAIIDEGIEPIEIGTGGSSDANIFAQKGFICSGLGIGIHNVHTLDEYIELEEIYSAYRIMLDIMTS